MTIAPSLLKGPSAEAHVCPEATRAHEPLLDLAQIQGNIIPGFDKSHAALIFLTITCAEDCAAWLGALTRFVATAEEVLAFRRLARATQARRRVPRGVVKSTWLNVALSYEGLVVLGKSVLDLRFEDQAFSEGMLRRTAQGRLGDPVNTGKEGDPVNWVVGGPGREAHLVVIVAADDHADLLVEVARLEQTIKAFVDDSGKPRHSGVELLYKQEGAVLPGALQCHEHFGFRDGISQPGIRGRLADGSFLVPSENPHNVHQGKPGQDLVWPGEFLFGYPGQESSKPFTIPGLDPLNNPRRRAPAWARNGSFLVVRRLRQYVGMFHRFTRDTAARFGVAPELIAAKLVGRWQSGASLVQRPNREDPQLVLDEDRLNDFEYGKEARLHPSGGDEPEAPARDPDGQSCPFVSHVRKVYPRNDTSRDLVDLDRSMAHTHRLLRRGIPYGEPSSSTPQAPLDDPVDRGLLFMAYQVSIEDQFEYVTKKFANDHNFKQHGLGYDPIIGQNDTLPNRFRTFKVSIGGELHVLSTYDEWVVPTGGGYFFAPSIDALLMFSRE